MNELMELCGFESSEINTQRHRFERAFVKLGITPSDIETAKHRLTKYFDTDLKGVRKILGYCLLGMVNITLCREEGKKKVIYAGMAPSYDPIGMAVVSQSEEVYVAMPDRLFNMVLGNYFNKLVPILEAAEGKWLRGGTAAHCSLIKTRLGLFLLDMIPRPDLMVTGGQMCETSPKNDELIHYLYDIPTFCYDSCSDLSSNEPMETGRRVDLGRDAINRLIQKTEEVAGFEIRSSTLQEVQNLQGRFMGMVGKISRLVESSDPIPINQTVINLIDMGASALIPSIQQMQVIIDAIELLYQELEERVRRGIGVVEKGSPRIISILPPSNSDPRLEQLTCDIGIASIASGLLPGSFARYSGHRPLFRDNIDVYDVMAASVNSSLTYNFKRKISALIGACRALKVNGVLDRYHVGCRAVSGDALLIKDVVTKELGIPVVLLEWENWDPRVYNHEQYKRRLELFKSIMTFG